MSAEPSLHHPPAVVALNPAETRELLDERARRSLGISGEEFERRWRAGEFAGAEERDDIWQLVFLLGGDFAGQ
ncbi:MAG: hypothetical protein IT303_16135 [Dehalococcoidia bacterium]|nr:hypothetical protein [Dehalococcoidia bacterium]